MRLIEAVGVVLAATLLVACKAADQPARIVDPTTASRAALQRTVSVALDGVEVRLADDALVGSSRLIIERKAFRDAQGNRIMGRDTQRPAQFRLIKSGESCFLVLQGGGARSRLADTTCRIE